MPGGDIAIVFDCGATNIRVIAINGKGKILASETFTNNTKPDPFYPAYRIWDVRDIWNNMCQASKKVTSKINRKDIVGVTVTTFGVDGTLFDKSGNMLYPVISWQCERTLPVIQNIEKYISLRQLYAESGVYPFSFNTICKLIWLSENRPDIIEHSSSFLFLPSIFSFFMTGEMSNDYSMAGTSMLTNMGGRNLSENIMNCIGLPTDKISPFVEAGTITGKVTAGASSITGLPEGTPVISTGHDTQFAIFGSGAGKNEPVLSSGTWEVLMVRSENYMTGQEQLEDGITTEFDSRPGLYNIGNQWLASGVLEWIKRNLFNDIKENVYDYMISSAEKVPAGSKGIKVLPSFNDGRSGGQISGLNMESTREEVYRAALEGLSERLAEGKKALEKAGGFKSESILCVGGGSRNRLWNQLKANHTGIPLKIIDQKETTVLGASFFVQAACGNAASPEEARSVMNYETEIFEPEE